MQFIKQKNYLCSLSKGMNLSLNLNMRAFYKTMRFNYTLNNKGKSESKISSVQRTNAKIMSRISMKLFSTQMAGVCPSQLEDTEKVFQRETKEYFVEQISTACLAQFAYYIESNGEAAVIDPMRDIEAITSTLTKRGAKLKYILETHFHADFVSGHVELAKSTGAKIVFGPQAKSKLDIHIAKDGEVLPLGKVGVKVVHTPGHTLESSSFVLLDTEKKPKAMFTGDFIFLGEVGRPDLAVGNGLTEKELATMLYESINKVKKEYPGEMVIFPGHGAGSACGKNILSGSSDTLRNQIKMNYALNESLTREQFIEAVTKNLPTPPKYFFFDAGVNKNGYATMDELKKNHQMLKPADFYKKFKSDSTLAVIDSREFSDSRKCFLNGSYLISLSTTYAIWVATFFKPEQKFLIIADRDKQSEAVLRLARVGYDNVVGILDGSFEDFFTYLNENNLKSDLTNISMIEPEEVKSVLEENSKSKKFAVVDVREKGEWESVGVVPQSHLYSLGGIESNAEKIKKLSPSIGLYCKTGGRATIAASILKKHGVKDAFVIGGYEKMKEHNVPFDKVKF